MKIVLISIGTRGDIEPFIAIASILKENGHNVVCIFPEQFRGIVEELNLRFASLGTKFIDSINSECGKSIMGLDGWHYKRLLAYIKFLKLQRAIDKELADKQFKIIEDEKPDRIVYNAKSTYPVIWELKNRGKTTSAIPFPYFHYVKGHTHIAFAGNYGTILNKLTYLFVHSIIVTDVMRARKWLKITDKINRKDIRRSIKHNKSIYTISPALYPRPLYWSKNLQVLGHIERDYASHWNPEKGLINFLKKQKKIIFITFGSMLNPEPEKKTRVILDVLERNNIPAIINMSSGGLVKLAEYDTSLIYFTQQIPYNWIFPRVYATVHHGGAGTTHMALKHGCATMIIPHIIDQFVWDKIVFEKRVGPRGIKIGKLNTKKLEPKILDLINNTNYKLNAEQIKHQMSRENFKEKIYNSIIS